MRFFGTVLMVMGAAIRVQCFCEMGIHFAFSPSIVYSVEVLTARTIDSKSQLLISKLVHIKVMYLEQ